MILHGDLIQAATDLVLSTETPLVEIDSSGDYSSEPLLASVREAASAYLVRAFGHAGSDDE